MPAESPEVNPSPPMFGHINNLTIYVSLQQVQAQMIIVIHPGSFNLRIGRASDLNPYVSLHAVARLRKPGGLVYADQFLPPAVPMVKDNAHSLPALH